jgi:hypothetical protein
MAMGMAMSWPRSPAGRAISASIPASQLRKQLRRPHGHCPRSCGSSKLGDGVQVQPGPLGGADERQSSQDTLIVTGGDPRRCGPGRQQPCRLVIPDGVRADASADVEVGDRQPAWIRRVLMSSE